MLQVSSGVHGLLQLGDNGGGELGGEGGRRGGDCGKGSGGGGGEGGGLSFIQHPSHTDPHSLIFLIVSQVLPSDCHSPHVISWHFMSQINGGGGDGGGNGFEHISLKE